MNHAVKQVIHESIEEALDAQITETLKRASSVILLFKLRYGHELSDEALAHLESIIGSMASDGKAKA